MLLYYELRDRLDERGVTPEEMQAAVNAGDAERVRELFGYTPEEFAEKNARAVALAEQVHRSGPDDTFVPEGAGCGWGMVDCGMGFLGWAWAFPGYAIGIFVGETVYCGLRNCHLKGTDPDPLAGLP